MNTPLLLANCNKRFETDGWPNAEIDPVDDWSGVKNSPSTGCRLTSSSVYSLPLSSLTITSLPVTIAVVNRKPVVPATRESLALSFAATPRSVVRNE